jgi:TRAP-type mannitol/chloroaromatic compound transport system permease small subunit
VKRPAAGSAAEAERSSALPEAVLIYVRWIETIGRVIGRLAMLLIFVMVGVLLYSAVMRTGFNRPPLWSVEMGQVLLAAYYLLGGAYSMQLDAHVRMDLLYTRWRPRKQAFADTITAVCLITYLVVLLMGGLSSTGYALEYNQTASTAWRPPLAPIKIIMTFGIFLMLLQAIATFFRDLARARGTEIA